MPFKYSCFISYCHGQGDLMKRFIEELKKALKSYLDPYLDEDVYIDEERLKPGYRFNEAIARAICHSVCMIVIYAPKYECHSYCLREYAAMEALETERFRLMGKIATQEYGMIIPIILRGKEEDLPPKIRGHRRFCDFSKFTTASPNISTHPEYVHQIDEIAYYIYRLYQDFNNLDEDLCSGCHSFELPAEGEIRPWREKAKGPVTPFVFR